MRHFFLKNIEAFTQCEGKRFNPIIELNADDEISDFSYAYGKFDFSQLTEIDFTETELVFRCGADGEHAAVEGIVRAGVCEHIDRVDAVPLTGDNFGTQKTSFQHLVGSAANGGFHRGRHKIDAADGGVLRHGVLLKKGKTPIPVGKGIFPSEGSRTDVLPVI